MSCDVCAKCPHQNEALARAWDEGRAAERRDWELLYDLVTPDEDRQPWRNPYRKDADAAQ